MLKLAIILAVTLIVTEAKTRRGPVPLNVWQKLKHLKHIDIDEKIVGGQEVEPYSIPYQISWQDKNNFHFCGGSIYDKNTIITAAHCCKSMCEAETHIVAGEHNLFQTEGFEQVTKVKSCTAHKGYGPFTFENDICLLHLDSDLDFNDKVSQVDLPNPGQDWISGNAIVSGWGRLSSGGESPDKLQSVIVPIVSDDECNYDYSGDMYPESMICAGAEGKDSCQGDSGGPLTCDGKLCGIVSWGIGCALPKYPGVYTQVAHFIDWIMENANN